MLGGIIARRVLLKVPSRGNDWTGTYKKAGMGIGQIYRPRQGCFLNCYQAVKFCPFFGWLLDHCVALRKACFAVRPLPAQCGFAQVPHVRFPGIPPTSNQIFVRIKTKVIGSGLHQACFFYLLSVIPTPRIDAIQYTSKTKRPASFNVSISRRPSTFFAPCAFRSSSTASCSTSVTSGTGHVGPHR